MTGVVAGMAAWPLPLKGHSIPNKRQLALVTFPSIRYCSDPSSEAAAIYTEQATKARKNLEFWDPGGLPSGRLVLRTHCTRAITQCHRRHLSPHARIRVSGPCAASQLQGLSS